MQPLRFRYQTVEFDSLDIHIRSLRDKNQFLDEQGEAEALGISSANWPIFGLLWESGTMLAELMHDLDVDNLRILEVGCGLGLASHVLNKREADITATDHHPEVHDFLDVNSTLNDLDNIPFVRTDWADVNDELGQFDLIIGSDLLYEQEHVQLLAKFINRHANQQCMLMIIDARRGYKAKFSKLLAAFGFELLESRNLEEQAIEGRYTSILLKFVRQSTGKQVSE